MIFKDKLLFDLIERISNLEDEVRILKEKNSHPTNENNGSSFLNKTVITTHSLSERANRKDLIKELNERLSSKNINFKSSSVTNEIIVSDEKNLVVSTIKLLNSKVREGNKNKVWTSWHTLNAIDIGEYDYYIFTVKTNENIEMFILPKEEFSNILTKKRDSERYHFRIFKDNNGDFYDEDRLSGHDPIKVNDYHNNLVLLYNTKS